MITNETMVGLKKSNRTGLIMKSTKSHVSFQVKIIKSEFSTRGHS